MREKSWRNVAEYSRFLGRDHQSHYQESRQITVRAAFACVSGANDTPGLDDFRRGSPLGRGHDGRPAETHVRHQLRPAARENISTSAVSKFRSIRFTFGKARYVELTHLTES